MKKITRKVKTILLSLVSLAICISIVGGIIYCYKYTPSLIDGRMSGGQKLFLIVVGGFGALFFAVFVGVLIWRFFRRHVVHPMKKYVFEMKTSAQEDDDHEHTE